MWKLCLALGACVVVSACGSTTNTDPVTEKPATEPAGAPTTSTPPSSGGASSATDAGAAIDDDGGDPNDPYATPVQCSSGTQWTNGDKGSANMQPGSACRTCHVVGGKASSKSWDIAGTVYATAHEPDNCNGTSASGVTVIITDATGKETSLSVNSVGNFYHNDLFGFAALPKPYHARVVSGGKVRKMVAAQTEGDCNSCHTESGTNSAPGRIMLP
jgi:hypothetical protein